MFLVAYLIFMPLDQGIKARLAAASLNHFGWTETFDGPLLFTALESEGSEKLRAPQEAEGETVNVH